MPLIRNLLKIFEMKISILALSLAFILTFQSAIGQSFDNNSAIQDSLSKLSILIWKQKSDTARLQASDILFKKFQTLLESGSSKALPLDSIRGITRVASDDGAMRIFTWNVPLDDGTNKYFGFIQFTNDSTVVIPLRSVYADQAGFEAKTITPQMWYGALYYKLIEVKIDNRKAYTLLGWDGYTSVSNRKIIDILSVDQSGNIVFGMPVFKTDQGIKFRIAKEYAEKSNMLIRYDYQSILVNKGKRVKKENAWLIVMDRLIPMDPSFAGMPKYYVPAGDTYDGYIFRNGYWVLVEDIDVTNRTNQKK